MPRQVRVSVRELAEIPRWAFVAAGCSAGEATVAGRVVQIAEVHLGCGVDAAVTELTDHRFSSAPIRRGRGAVDTFDDECGRGLLTLAPLAAAVVASRGADGGPLLVAGVPWHAAVAAVLADVLASSSGDGPLCAWSVTESGAPGPGVAVRVEPFVVTPLDPGTAPVAGGLRSGVLFGSGAPIERGGDDGVADDPVDRALVDGVMVDESQWTALYAAASRFLVPES